MFFAIGLLLEIPLREFPFQMKSFGQSYLICVVFWYSDLFRNVHLKGKFPQGDLKKSPQGDLKQETSRKVVL